MRWNQRVGDVRAVRCGSKSSDLNRLQPSARHFLAIDPGRAQGDGLRGRDDPGNLGEHLRGPARTPMPATARQESRTHSKGAGETSLRRDGGPPVPHHTRPKHFLLLKNVRAKCRETEPAALVSFVLPNSDRATMGNEACGQPMSPDLGRPPAQVAPTGVSDRRVDLDFAVQPCA